MFLSLPSSLKLIKNILYKTIKCGIEKLFCDHYTEVISTLGYWDDVEWKNNHNNKLQGVKYRCSKLHNALWTHVLLSRGCQHFGFSLPSNLVSWTLHLNPRCLFACGCGIALREETAGRWCGSISRSFPNMAMRGNVVYSEDKEKTLSQLFFRFGRK